MFSIRKARAPTPHDFVAKSKPKKSKAGKDALKKLNDYLNSASSEPMYFLHNFWKAQSNAITYKELREAIMNGYLDEATLQAWQQDYSLFVKSHLEPIWQQAAKAGADALAASASGGWVFDPMSDAMTAWIKDHGAEWVTKINDETRDAMRAMIEASTKGQFTVDELSRAIRPLIGLTEPQAAANLKYYASVKKSLLDNGVKADAATKKAREQAYKYADKQLRQRAYTIAITENAAAYCAGYREGAAQAQAQGYLGKGVYVFATADDEDVCPVCSALNGTETDAEGSYHIGTTKMAFKMGPHPPVHPRCRCAEYFEEKEPPVFLPQQPAQDVIQPWPGNLPDPSERAEDEGQAFVAGSLKVPDGMTSNGPVHLGNTGKMYDYTDANGWEWYFKPAQSKGGQYEPFRAYAQEAGYKVQSIVDPDTAVPVGVGTIDGKFGAFQEKVKTSAGGIDLEAWQLGAASDLPPEVTAQIQREHVTDWLLGNFDAHGENFLTDQEGRIVGIDKEQAFRYMGDAKSHVMSYTYHPNSAYGETEPVYNTLFRRFAEEDIDLNLQDTLPYIKRVESIPDKEYREIFRPYAEALHGQGKEAEKLLDEIVERKSTLRETYRTFYESLLTERTGTKASFVWADEAAAVAKQPLAAVQITPQAAKGMTVQDLKQIAKSQGVAYYSKMSKAQLVQAVTDPVKAAELSQEVKAKAAANAAARKAKAQYTAPQATIPKGVKGAGEIFSDLSKVPTTQEGIPIASDRGSVEGLVLRARRMNIDGAEVYEVSGNLTQGTWARALKTIKPSSATEALEFEEASKTSAFFSSSGLSLGVNTKCRAVHDGEKTLQIYTHEGGEYYSWQGFFRARVPVTADGGFDAREMKKLLKTAGLDDLTETPTVEAEKRLIKSRLVWQNAPSRAPEYENLTSDALDKKLDEILKDLGIDQKRVDGVELRKVCDGYAVYYDPAQAKALKAAGADYVWCGVGSADSVVSIIQSGGLRSTNRRCLSGIRLTGASPSQDMRTGGADNVFTRIGVKNVHGKVRYDKSFCGSGYRLIIDEAELGRTDWYAYTGDNFGTTQPSTFHSRQGSEEFVRGQKEGYYQSGNEIMFRQGIPATSIQKIRCPGERERGRLLQAFRNAGITEVNGVPIEDFVEVGDLL